MQIIFLLTFKKFFKILIPYYILICFFINVYDLFFFYVYSTLS